MHTGKSLLAAWFVWPRSKGRIRRRGKPQQKPVSILFRGQPVCTDTQFKLVYRLAGLPVANGPTLYGKKNEVGQT